MIQEASSESRKAVAAATSSGVPIRPRGYPAATCSSPSVSSAAANRVRTIAGVTALTRTAGASSRASSSVRCRTAALVAP